MIANMNRVFEKGQKFRWHVIPMSNSTQNSLDANTNVINFDPSVSPAHSHCAVC